MIDADAIEINEKCTFYGKGIKAFLDAIPTAYDMNKVVEQIRQIPENYCDRDVLSMINDVVEIVKSSGIE